ncbi:FtsX-like permease family protein, partial [Candidatus Rickettsia tasmanensis]
DIAILSTMGASTKQIMLIFIYNGMFIGLLGTTLGVILGVTFSYNIQTIKNYLERITGTKIFEAAIYFLYSLPSKVRAEDIILITCNLGVTVGDKIRLISPNSVSTTFGSIPRSKEFKVIAIFNSGMYDYDLTTILMPLTAAQNFLSLGDDINLIEINSLDPNNALAYSY